MQRKFLYNLNYFRARISGSREAVFDAACNRRYTYGQLYERAGKLADFLVHDCGLGKGDVVAFCSSNAMAFIDAFFAGYQTGIIISTYNHKLQAGELAEMIRSENPRILFYEESIGEKIQTIRENTRVQRYYTLYAGDGPGQDPPYEQILERPYRGPLETDIDPEDIQMYLHTGGTTGRPKTALISFRAMFYNCVCDVFTNGLSAEDCAYVFLPFSHTSAWNIITIPLLMCGGRIILGRRFDADRILEIISRERPTVGMAVPVCYKRMAESPRFLETDFSCFKWMSTGGGPAQLGIMQHYWDRGIRLANGYGMTEVGPHNLTFPLVGMELNEIRKKWNSVGLPMYFNSVRVVDEQGRDVPEGTTGELCFSGPLVFSGYLHDRENRELGFQDGWVRTGDMVRVDAEGYYYIMGRKKHMYISGGENIYTTEIEEIISAFPAVQDVCVIGVPDDHWGEVGKALLVVDADTFCMEAFRQYLAQTLASIKIPRYIEEVDQFPLTGAGKKDMARIRELYG